MEGKQGIPINLKTDRVLKIKDGESETVIYCDLAKGRRVRLRVKLPDGAEVEFIRLEEDSACTPPPG